MHDLVNPEEGTPMTVILALPEMADVMKELADPRFSGRSHGSRATYALKCEGPLCKIAERLRGRRRNEAKAARLGIEYIPGDNRIYDRDDLLLAVIAWHKMDLYRRKLEQGGAA